MSSPKPKDPKIRPIMRIETQRSLRGGGGGSPDRHPGDEPRQDASTDKQLLLRLTLLIIGCIGVVLYFLLR